MMRKNRWLALFVGLGVVLVGCSKPCDTSTQCGGEEVCAAAICQKLSCEQAIFAIDPDSGSCVALSGCFLTAAQRGWQTCSDDPCKGLGENGCVADNRCQPAYANPDVQQKISAFGGGEDRASIACAGGPTAPPPERPNGESPSPGVNNGDAPKHARPNTNGCVPNTARVYAGCRAVPQIAPRVACEKLDEKSCAARPDCQRPDEAKGGFGPFPAPQPEREPGPDGGNFTQAVCFPRVSISSSCEGADAMSCLLSPKCQPIGAACFCPTGGACACDGGAFLGCESNDRLRRCQQAADCGAGERCDNDEACISPRTFARDLSSAPEPVPGTGSCLGACVPMGCEGFGEGRCHGRPECDGGTYGTVCRPKPYCTGGRGDPPAPGDPADPADPAGGVGATCGCETEFMGCAPQPTRDGLRPERSLLVRDAEIVGASAFRLDNVIRRLAPAGKGDDFVRTWFQRLGASAQLQNGAQAPRREGYNHFLRQIETGGQLTLEGIAGLFHATALVNRVDLATTGDCGEARITYALSRGYSDGNQRMTVIFELRVPDDGNGCRTVAQRWGELSLLQDSAERLRRLEGIYNELLVPAQVGQLRTNEFLNSFGREAWELREWHLGPDGLPRLVPVKQTLDPRHVGTSDLLGWARQNAQGLKAGTAIVPDRFLAAVSTENGARLRLNGAATDTALKDAEKGLNALSCAGCHLTETRSPFAHIGERLGKRVAGGYQPDGRAVIDEFLQKELVTRSANLRRILNAPAAMGIQAPWRGLIQARVH